MRLQSLCIASAIGIRAGEKIIGKANSPGEQGRNHWKTPDATFPL
jgi:hypothetical protein